MIKERILFIQTMFYNHLILLFLFIISLDIVVQGQDHQVEAVFAFPANTTLSSFKTRYNGSIDPWDYYSTAYRWGSEVSFSGSSHFYYLTMMMEKKGPSFIISSADLQGRVQLFGTNCQSSTTQGYCLTSSWTWTPEFSIEFTVTRVQGPSDPNPYFYLSVTNLYNMVSINIGSFTVLDSEMNTYRILPARTWTIYPRCLDEYPMSKSYFFAPSATDMNGNVLQSMTQSVTLKWPGPFPNWNGQIPFRMSVSSDRSHAVHSVGRVYTILGPLYNRYNMCLSVGNTTPTQLKFANVTNTCASTSTKAVMYSYPNGLGADFVAIKDLNTGYCLTTNNVTSYFSPCTAVVAPSFKWRLDERQLISGINGQCVPYNNTAVVDLQTCAWDVSNQKWSLTPPTTTPSICVHLLPTSPPSCTPCISPGFM
ncbi:hypothetical protein SAMD00019534_042340 [Acytostelium subglobosum LB1]|uniref:hypothetical protein n=1 Tax=Acytostelium subglobosum LB1 TaxID=1410327 RepID=UPI0006450A1E|nr:hypothetical protein SAMD00019534_042340 [Acytostelium subglobosum LB1]GAM21059.1 hypothetical protein SAMD00019534_042340 [Acytostelium subglobosum LB1]|eukprot:XP_012756193.1 hypothetical protein SAMD00019534_042340 [Acytostelium subglobosum LB1]